MKFLALAAILIVLVVIGMAVYYAYIISQQKSLMKQRAETPWRARDFERDGKWIVVAYRPDHDNILLAEQPIEDGFLAMAVTQARADAYENFMALNPRGRWDLDG